MKNLLTAGVLAALAVPAFADEDAASAPRLDALETIVITAVKDEPVATPSATDRLRELEILVTTAPKEQPASYQADAETAALLEKIASAGEAVE